MNQRGKTVGFHLLGWALFFALVVAFVQGFKQDFSPLYTFSFLLFVVIYVALFYLNGFVFLPKLYLQRRYISYFLVSAVFLLLVFLIKPFDRMVMHNARPQQDGPGSVAPAPPPRGDFGPPPHQAPGRRSQDFDIVSIVLFLGIWSASSVLQIVRQ